MFELGIDKDTDPLHALDVVNATRCKWLYYLPCLNLDAHVLLDHLSDVQAIICFSKFLVFCQFQLFVRYKLWIRLVLEIRSRFTKEWWLLYVLYLWDYFRLPGGLLPLFSLRSFAYFKKPWICIMQSTLRYYKLEASMHA